MNLKIPTAISYFIVDAPWHSWGNKHQTLQFQYKEGNDWKTVAQVKPDF